MYFKYIKLRIVSLKYNEIGVNMYKLVKPLLFKLDPEKHMALPLMH